MSDKTEQPRTRETGAAGVGMPATLHLHAFGREIAEAFGGELPYLVGSAARGKAWRDVDVRLILPDNEYDALFPGHAKPDHVDGRWALLCAAISELGTLRTGLPIDFQIQRMSEANDLYGSGVRHALGLRLHWPA
jgi:predicted nucleotidyltransferase